MMFERKRCNRCLLYKTLDSFGINQRMASGFMSTCKLCHAANARKYRKIRKAADPFWEQRINRLYTHGLSSEDYITMVEVQQGVCAICDSVEFMKGSSGASKPLSVDHDHKTKQVRALLCSRCNTMLGFARDDSSILRAAAEYIDYWKDE